MKIINISKNKNILWSEGKYICATGYDNNLLTIKTNKIKQYFNSNIFESNNKNMRIIRLGISFTNIDLIKNQIINNEIKLFCGLYNKENILLSEYIPALNLDTGNNFNFVNNNSYICKPDNSEYYFEISSNINFNIDISSQNVINSGNIFGKLYKYDVDYNSFILNQHHIYGSIVGKQQL